MIKITLSAANMGPESTEADFDAWTSYVNEHVDEIAGETVEVDQFAFSGRGAESEDRIEGAGDKRGEIRSWLSVDGWERFCSESSAAA